MKKLISFLIGLASVISVFLAIAIPTDFFKDWSVFIDMFHKAGDKVNETFGAVEPQVEASSMVDDSVMNKGSANVGVVLDSEDTPITVNVEQVNNLNSSYFASDGSFHLIKTHSGAYASASCDVYSEFVGINSAGFYTYSDRVLLKDSVPLSWSPMPYGGMSFSSDVVVTLDEIKAMYSKQFETYYPLIRLTYIFKAPGFMDSDPVYKMFYVGEAPTLTWVSDTVLEYTGVPAPTSENTGLAQDILSCYKHVFSIDVGTKSVVEGNGFTTFTENSVIDGDSYSVYGTENAECFTATVENGRSVVRCDLSMFKHADTVGEYLIKASVGTVDCHTVPGPTGGGTTWIDAPVWGHALEISFSVSRLSAPTNVRMENTSLKWDEVPGAQGYAVFDGDTSSWTVKEPVFDLKGKGIANGEHTFRIRALGNVGSSLSSAASNSKRLTAFNASNNITPLVVVTYNVCGDTITKLVPRGKSLSEYLYDVELDGKIFGGWFYDQGYSNAVESDDKLETDVTVYARMVDKEVEEPVQSWWDKYMWWILGPALVIGGLLILAIVAAVIRKRKS